MSINSRMIHAVSPSENIYEHTMRNRNGMEVCVLDYGATISSIKVPVVGFQSIDVVLGFEKIENYMDSFQLPSPPYLGAIVGPIAGRIDQASCNFKGQKIKFDTNHGMHQLHGGFHNMSQHLWKLDHVTDRDEPSITFRFFPTEKSHFLYQNLDVLLSYKLLENNTLEIEIHGNSSIPSLLNMTQHTYFNLDGHDKAVTNQMLSIQADEILLVNENQIPTGETHNLTGNSFDFNVPKKVPQSLDTTFILKDKMATQMQLKSSEYPLQMIVATNQPCVHVYVGGNCFEQIKGKKNADYHTTSGICFETQFPPNAPNIDHFPSIEINAEKPYHHKTSFKFESF